MGSVFGPSPKQLTINFTPHVGQQEVNEALKANFMSQTPASIIELICSRGWGKTLWVVCNVLMPYLLGNPNAKVMWVAPNYQIGQSPIDDVFKGTDELTGQHYIPQFDDEGNKIWDFVTTKAGPQLTIFNGATVIIRSAESPDSIVSKGFNLIIMDEAALISKEVFEKQILGTARKAGIKIFLITTPRGKKHFTYNFYVKGQNQADTEYLSFQQPWHKNPYFNKTLEKLMMDLPDWLRRQEYGAEFIEDGDSVFKNLDSVMTGPEIEYPGSQQEWSAPITDVKSESGDIISASDRRFVTAMDIAKSVDFTVITVLDLDSSEIVYYRRLNKTDYRQVLQLASEVCQTYNNAELIFDATGVGSGLADMLNNYDVTCHPFIFTNESKNDIVNKLILAVEYQQLKLPNIKEMRKELSVFTYELTRTGKISYNAPSGFHDDIVMSLALANWFKIENTAPTEVQSIENIITHNNYNADRPRSYLEEMMDDND